jgi:predicted nucleic acid-binding protein
VRLYVDTNVIISLVMGEFGRANEYMEERVRTFLAACLNEGHTLLISDLFEDELIHKAPYASGWEKDFAAGIRLERVVTIDADVARARRLVARASHFKDALHAAIAERCGADLVVTWNVKDFHGSPVTAVKPDFFS